MKTLICTARRRRIADALVLVLGIFFIATNSIAQKSLPLAPALPVLWTAGGLDAGNTGAGQASRMAVDATGNIALASSYASIGLLNVTSYTPAGTQRWRSSITPGSGTFNAHWIVAAPNGDIIAMAAKVNSDSGLLFGVTVVRFGEDGTFKWRVDSTTNVLRFGRLVVDAGGNAYFSYNSTLYKYSPDGTLLWSVNTGLIDHAAALTPDGSEIVLTGALGGFWRTGVFNTSTGRAGWRVDALEGTAATDLVVETDRIYVAGQGQTGVGTPQITQWLTVIAYDRATGTRLWRTDKKPAGSSAPAGGAWIAKAPDGSLRVAGYGLFNFLDWYTVALETNGAVRWEAVRNGGLNTDEVPRGIIVLADGTTVVTGVGGPSLPGGFIQGVTAGYNDNGTLLWEAFSRQATVWAVPMTTGDFCASGGYDALITCFDVPGGGQQTEPTAVIAATPVSGQGPLNVSFDGRGSTGPNTIASWNWNFGDGATATGSQTSHVYKAPGTYTASLVVTDVMGISSQPRTVSIVVDNPPIQPPTAPTDLSAMIRFRTSVVVSWTNTSSNQTGVQVERCSGRTCTNFVHIATTFDNESAYTDSGLAANSDYRYRVRAVNSAGASPYSGIVRVRTTKR